MIFDILETVSCMVVINIVLLGTTSKSYCIYETQFT